MNKRLLTVDDLLNFCQTNKLNTFSASKSGYLLAVQFPTTFEIMEKNDNSHRGMLKLKFRLMHDGINRNHSYLSKESIERVACTIADRPILAAIHQLDDGTWDFKGHEMEINTDENGNQNVEYIEKQVGSFSSEKPFWEYDEDLDKNYLCAYGYIAEEYTMAAEIIKEKSGTKNSVELNIENMAYNSIQGCIEFIDYYMSASTLLGSRNDGTEIEEGMLGSRADIIDFSIKNNSVFSYEVIEKIIDESVQRSLNKYTATFADDSKRKEEKDKLNTELFNKLCEQYSVSESDITFEYSELDDEALTAAFAEHFDGEDGGSDDSDNSTEDGSDSVADDGAGAVDSTEDSGASDVEDNTDAEDTQTVSITSDNSTVGNEDEDDQDGIEANNSYPSGVKEYQLEYVLKNGEDVHNFSISMNDEITALTDLVNLTYCEEDNDWYYVEVYGAEKTVVMHGWYKHFKQKYTVKDGVYSLKGDRTEVFAKYLTQEEIDALDGLKTKFAEVSDKLALYESEPEKVAVLSSEEYSLIKDTEEFKEISKRENYFSLSKEDLVTKLDSMLNSYAKELGKKSFSVEESKEEKKEEINKDFFAFAKVETKSSFLDGLLGRK